MKSSSFVLFFHFSIDKINYYSVRRSLICKNKDKVSLLKNFEKIIAFGAFHDLGAKLFRKILCIKISSLDTKSEYSSDAFNADIIELFHT